MYTASWGDVARRDLFGSRPDRRDRPYRIVIRLALIVFRLFRFRFDVRGQEHVPTEGGAIICSNHVSFFDFTYLGLAALPQHRLVRFMAKASVFTHWFSGPFMRAMQHIPVDRKAGAAAFDSAVRALKDGQVVGVFPEATISSSFTVKDLKAGAARMAIDAGVPIIPAAVWGGHRIATKGHDVVLRRNVPVTVLLGEPLVPEPGERAQALLRRTRAAMEALLDEAQQSYPDQPAGDDDRWWLPAHLGGTAPTPEQAAEKDAAYAAGHKVKATRTPPLQQLRKLISRR
ncbi:lysophospholipid acyltransferase family protein [Modestobacter versicolor]|uniref:1-acyl-sn-glycerol-3-phosphate acyltransferase n=1 Tax=Modestobacter versicolor TaxID=429133 RepID=A0A323V6Z0_9ACTN|nr:lysophospholipid acyltransferase family protein [Modestobacter versicolor]MBB3675253.1 1-acyl-sn-glycerol-3-phosphate acyltransferase [Modestobacter versicolor]PZA20424.1 1-acyl-sn-glycerol-3-phosphate acyltransferase [Modestobacter versicolor]